MDVEVDDDAICVFSATMTKRTETLLIPQNINPNDTRAPPWCRAAANEATAQALALETQQVYILIFVCTLYIPI